MPNFQGIRLKPASERGYGTDHRKARAAALRELRDGIDRCHFCHHPMWRTQRLALDHTDDRTAYRGLTHATCNQRDGARKGGRAALAKRRGTRGTTGTRQGTWHSRNW